MKNTEPVNKKGRETSESKCNIQSKPCIRVRVNGISFSMNKSNDDALLKSGTGNPFPKPKSKNHFRDVDEKKYTDITDSFIDLHLSHKDKTRDNVQTKTDEVATNVNKDEKNNTDSDHKKRRRKLNID